MENVSASNNTSSNEHKWEKIAVFIFGVTFISTLLFVVLKEDLNERAYSIIRIIMALAVAGVGACIPGFLDVQLKGFIRAGGAMALFVIVYFFTPDAPSDIDIPPPPSQDPTISAEQWFSLVDAAQYSAAWNLSSSASKVAYPLAVFLTLLNNQRTPLGRAKDRKLTGVAQSTLYNGRHGNFRFLNYQTAFESGSQLREIIVVEGEGDSWKVFEHGIIPL